MTRRKLLPTLLALLIALTFPQIVHAADTVVVGTITNASNPAPLSSANISFQLNQAGVVSGSAVLATTPVYCATDLNGAIRGVQDPLVQATAAANYASGTVPAAAYWVGFSYYTADGTTATSPAIGITLSGTGRIIFTAPALQPSTATGYKVYVGTTPTALKLQATTAGWGTTTVSSYNAAGASAPSLNGTICRVIANDSIIPSYTSYRTTVNTAAGGTVPGFPIQVYFTTGTVDVTTAWPLASTQTRFPQPIIANPASQATQSINSPLTLNGYALTAGTVVFPDNNSPPTPQAGTGYIYNTDGTLNIVADAVNISPFTYAGSCIASSQVGATAGAKLAACVSSFSSVGGVVDGRGLTGAQTISQNIFAGSAGGAIQVLLGTATFTISQSQVIPARSGVIGVGNGTKFVASGMTYEVFQLSDDFAYIRDMWLNGPGQDPNTPDGRRGVWVGCSAPPHVVPCAATVGNVVSGLYIDQFTGNGISGEYAEAVIVNNVIEETTDAGIFVTSTSSYNLIQGNTVIGSRYAGIDVNGQYNRVIGNFLRDNGGGTADPQAWSGILIANVTDANPAHGNIVIGNTSQNNLGCGIALIGMVTGMTIPAYGTIIDSNVVTGHTNITAPATIFPGGVCAYSGDATIVSNNFARANRDNFVVSGYGEATNSGLTKVVNNQSLSATRYGFYFVESPLLTLAGEFPPYHSDIRGNTDTGAVTTAYMFEPQAAGTNWGYYTIYDNKCFAPGAGYCFQNTQPTVLTQWDFQRNFGISYPAGQYQAGFNAAGLTVNSTTPSVANRTVAILNNNMPTTITNLTNGYEGQTVQMYARDAGNSTFDFSANPTMVGNNGADFTTANGDVVTCTLDATVWYCSIIQG